MKKIKKIGMVVAMTLVLYGCQNTSSMFLVSSTAEGNIIVTAENASSDTGARGYITVEEGQSITIDAELSEKSSVQVEIAVTETGEVLAENKITGGNDMEVEVPAGEYVINFTAEEGATGSLTVSAE